MVSIIVPVYEVENYIERCINSILHQTYQDIEIILVDDGSPDNCGKMCDDYAKTNDRIRVIHKKNGGLSSARNAGIEAATGEYLCFVDSDDWVTENYIQSLLTALISCNADMAACGIMKTTTENVEHFSIANTLLQVSKEKYYYALTEEYYAGFACNKLYKSSIIKDNNLRFDVKIFNGEDLPFVIDYLRFCKKVAYIKEVLYFYFIRPISITTTTAFSSKKYSIIYAREKVLETIKKVSPENTDLVISGYLQQLIKMEYRLYPEKEIYCDVYTEIKGKIERYRKTIFKLRGISLKTKIKLYFMIQFPRITGILYRKTKGK